MIKKCFTALKSVNLTCFVYTPDKNAVRVRTVTLFGISATKHLQVWLNQKSSTKSKKDITNLEKQRMATSFTGSLEPVIC